MSESSEEDNEMNSGNEEVENVVTFLSSSSSEGEDDLQGGDDEYFKKIKRREERKASQRIEFQTDETKEKFLSALQTILSSPFPNIDNNVTTGNPSGLPLFKNFNRKVVQMKEKEISEIQSRREDFMIFNKDHFPPNLTSQIGKETELRRLATDGVVELLRHVVKERKRRAVENEKVDNGYEALEKQILLERKKETALLTKKKMMNRKKWKSLKTHDALQ